MNSIQQTLILTNRNRILQKLESTEGTLQARMKDSTQDVAQLGGIISQWVDGLAIQYRDAGMDIDEWYDDVVQWFQKNEFLVEEQSASPQPSGRVQLKMHCHLSTKGVGRHVIIQFILIK